MKSTIALLIIVFSVTLLLVTCTDSKNETTATKEAYGGFESQVKWGENLVKIGGCNDCYTPKKMGPNGPENDMSLMLSGHPAQMPAPDFDPKEAAKKGLILTQTFTS